MPSSNIRLRTTPGITFPNAGMRVGAGELNRAASPLVELIPEGLIGRDFLNMGEITNDLTAAAAGRNYFRRSNFDPVEWVDAAGIEAIAGTETENAWDWWTLCEASDPAASITARRAEAKPTAASQWGVELIGDTGITLTRFYTYVGPGVAGGLQGQTSLTFAIWLRNEEASPVSAQCFIGTSPDLDSRATCTETDAQAAQTLAPGAWTRLTWIVTPADLPNLHKGFTIGVKTAALNSATKSMLVAQALLRPGPAAGDYSPPEPDAASRQPAAPEMTEAESAGGAKLLVQLSTGLRRVLPPPPAWMTAAKLGWNHSTGLPEWQDPDGLLLVLQFTGADQVVTVPAGMAEYYAYCWGAGAGSEGGCPGGVGGFAWGRFACAPGDLLSVIVGESGPYASFRTRRPYGFGGKGGTSVTHGGGLSGVFTGGTPVGAGDLSRGRVIAGGGGGLAFYDPVHGLTSTTQGFAGGNGGDPSSTYAGGESSMQGIDSSTTNCGGGGGAAGGGALPNGGGGGGGKGGTSLVHGSALASGVAHTARVNPVDAGSALVVPQSSHQYYAYRAGQSETPGLVVIKWVPTP